MTVYSDFQQEAKLHLEEKSSGKIRVLVQVGYCSLAVGAGTVAGLLETALAGSSDAYLVTAGCDGACFAAP